MTNEQYLEIQPGTGQCWVYIERTSDPDDDRGPDLYLGPFPPGTEHLAMICANESLLVEDELTSHLGGTECMVVTEDPDVSTGGVILIDHNDPNHTGYDKSATCRFCGHSIVRISNRVDETWYAPDAGYDRVNGDGIWLESCPDNNDDITAPHEPEESA